MKKDLWRIVWVVLLGAVFSTAAGQTGSVCLWAKGLPERSDTLRILGVGNSFTDDGMMYLPDLLREAGVGNVVLGRLYFPGCSLEQHVRFYASGDDPYIYYKSEGNTWRTVDERASLTEALQDERWDVVVLQQASHFSGDYDTYVPWLDKLIGIVLSHNANPDLCLAWQATWAYAGDSTHDGFGRYGRDQRRMFEAIEEAVRRMQAEAGIGVIVPSGAVIQRLREAGVPSVRDLTRDGYHLDLGAGRYAAACVWFEALVAPVLGVPVVGNGFRIPQEGPETTPVDDANASLIQRTAADAAAHPFAGMGR